MLANTQKIHELKQVQFGSLFSASWTWLHVTCPAESSPILRQFSHQYQTMTMPRDAKAHRSLSGFKEDTRKYSPSVVKRAVLPTCWLWLSRPYLHPCPQRPHPVSQYEWHLIAEDSRMYKQPNSDLSTELQTYIGWIIQNCHFYRSKASYFI